MEKVVRVCVFTISTILMTTDITTQEISCFAPAPVAGAGSQPTQLSRALLLFTLFIFFDHVSKSLFTTNNVNVEDPDPLMSTNAPTVDSEQNLFANIISNNLSLYDEFVPNQMDMHYHDENLADYNQITSLTSSDLQEIESMGTHERNNLHSGYAMDGSHHVLRGETSQPYLAHEVVDHDHNNCSRGITLTDLQQQYGKKIDDAAESLGVSRSTFKRICRANGIARWSSKLRIVQQPINVKVSYNGVNVKFPLSFSSGKMDLEVEVEKRFGIQIGSFWIEYEDEDKEWIRITCDEDLHHGMNTCMERGITTMKMHVA